MIRFLFFFFFFQILKSLCYILKTWANWLWFCCRNYNYGQCGRAIGQDLLNNPDLVASDAVISLKTALWFWMTPQSPKSSSHDVITGRWTPTSGDWAARRYPGYGVITNIINGGIECGKGWNENVDNRIGFYKIYCDIQGVGYGDNLDCYSQTPFGNALPINSAAI